ncbi:MAG: class II glutamine amidotransferase [Thermoleophilaceae bacterium]|jgi:predicted glutamine amidotransferase|nr:class II glutamine amidotransferase [Thermoleophilaceae bacterium]
MCRIFGCVAAEPVSIRNELLHAENPMIRQSQEHDSGWGMAVYPNVDCAPPRCVRFPEAAYTDGEFQRATALQGRIFNVHVRRATMGGLTMPNTHPFCLGDYSLSHNGTILHFPRLLEEGVRPPAGDTDSEHFFNFLMRDVDPADIVGSLRHAVTEVIDRSEFSGLNVLVSEGERLYAYRLGIFELHWLARPGQLLVASEKLTGEAWHSVGQDVLLTLDPQDLEQPHAERLVGDEVVARATIEKYEEGAELRGEARGTFAAERAARLAGVAREG